MRATLIVDGKEFPIEILDKELQNLISGKKNTGYERCYKETYFCVTGYDEIHYSTDQEGRVDDMYFDTANYYISKELAENNARADKLMRQLRRFAVEHREEKFDWEEDRQRKFYICYEHLRGELHVYNAINSQLHGVVYFASYNTATAALSKFKDELIWYFTEYKDSL